MRLYTEPVPGSHTVCLDEMGPVAAKVYPGARWSEGTHRPHFTPDYRRGGKVWVLGALEPATGQVVTNCAQRRNSAALVAFLDEVEHFWPEGPVHVVLDNLSIHISRATCLWLLGHPRFTFHFLPTYSPWLNLIEPWWKTLRKLALDGTHPQDVSELVMVIAWAAAYWNDHSHPYSWKRTA